jgi:hypothetical protein
MQEIIDVFSKAPVAAINGGCANAVLMEANRTFVNDEFFSDIHVPGPHVQGVSARRRPDICGAISFYHFTTTHTMPGVKPRTGLDGLSEILTLIGWFWVLLRQRKMLPSRNPHGRHLTGSKRRAEKWVVFMGFPLKKRLR